MRLPLAHLLDWGSPQILYGLTALLALPLLWMLMRRKELYHLAKLGPGGINLVHYIYCRFRARIRIGLICLGIAGLIIGLARPRDGYESIDQPTQTKSLLVAVDVSASMNATDIKPSRLGRAIREIIDLTELWAAHELGLIIFAGQAYMHLPLTQDLTMVRLFAKSLAVDMVSAQGTDLGAAIALAINNLTTADTQRRRASQDLLIITDGEDHPNQVLTIAGEAQTHGIRIFTMGLGSPEGAPIRLVDGSFKRDPGGDLVISKLDEHTLIQLANITGGHYVRSEAGRQDLLELYEQGLKEVPERPAEAADLRLWHELYLWPSLLALICFILAFLISPYRPVRSLLLTGGGALFIASLMPYPHASAASERELFDQAATVLSQPQPSAEALQAATAALLELSRRAQGAADHHLLHAAQYNLFHLYIKQGQLEQAYQAIVAAYAAHDTHAATLENLQWLKHILETAQAAADEGNQQPQSPPDQAEQESNTSPDSPSSSTSGSPSQDDAKEAMMNPPASAQQQSPEAQNQASSGAAESQQGAQGTAEPAPPNHSPTDPTEDKESGMSHAATAESGEDSDTTATSSATPAPPDNSPTAMAPDQAENLFRSLEENLEIFGRRHHDSGESKRNATKDW